MSWIVYKYRHQLQSFFPQPGIAHASRTYPRDKVRYALNRAIRKKTKYCLVLPMLLDDSSLRYMYSILMISPITVLSAWFSKGIGCIVVPSNHTVITDIAAWNQNTASNLVYNLISDSNSITEDVCLQLHSWGNTYSKISAHNDDTIEDARNGKISSGNRLAIWKTIGKLASYLYETERAAGDIVSVVHLQS